MILLDFFYNIVHPNYSEEDDDTREESHEVYKKYQVEIHKDEPNKVGQRQWERFLCDNPFQEEGKASGFDHQLGLYHCHYRERFLL